MELREQYLKARNQLVIGKLPVVFLKAWCIEEGRDFNELQMIFMFPDMFLKNPFEEETYKHFKMKIISSMIDYFDLKYKVTLIFNKEKEIIKCI